MVWLVEDRPTVQVRPESGQLWERRELYGHTGALSAELRSASHGEQGWRRFAAAQIVFLVLYRISQLLGLCCTLSSFSEPTLMS